VMGTFIISMRHALEERAVTPPATVAAHMSSAMLRALGLSPKRAQLLADRAAQAIFGPPVLPG
jgi:hypothetical protein